MFDEPSSGLAPKLLLEVFRVIESLREQGITIALLYCFEENLFKLLKCVH